MVNTVADRARAWCEANMRTIFGADKDPGGPARLMMELLTENTTLRGQVNDLEYELMEARADANSAWNIIDHGGAS